MYFGIHTLQYQIFSPQFWIPLRNDNGAVSITTAHWLTPKERQIHKQGLTPDIIVEITDEDIEAEKDPQLDMAVELLLNP